MVICRVVLLDQENFETEVAKGALGQQLYDNVKQKLNLEEADYFSLSYRDTENTRFWLNLDKKLDKQMEKSQQGVFYWEVKFYPPAPEILNEDLTRYLVVLQVRQDLYSGRLPASFQSLALLGSYTVQSEIGDHDKSVHTGIEYLRAHRFGPKQSDELLLRIADLHRTHKGLTPAEADLYFLDNAKKFALYGVDLYPVKDSTNRDIIIGISACGLYIYDGKIRMDSFKWQRILKISYKRNIFFVKVRPAEFEKLEKTNGFKLPSPKLAKRLWRIAVENHQFFRLTQAELTDSRTLPFGPRKWRMSGRTQAQLKSTSTISRMNSISSSDNYSTGVRTLPVPAPRRDVNGSPNYRTYDGRGNEKLVTAKEGNALPDEDSLTELRASRLGDPNLTQTPSKAPLSNEDSVLGQNGLDPHSEELSNGGVGTLDKSTRRIPPLQEKPEPPKVCEDAVVKEAAPLAVEVVPPTGPFGVGELLLPLFSFQSAGVTEAGVLSDSVKLATSERGEKATTERDGHTHKKVVHKITVSGEDEINDQLLLDAIKAVTGLNPDLSVDKIEIKTEEDAT